MLKLKNSNNKYKKNKNNQFHNQENFQIQQFRFHNP